MSRSAPFGRIFPVLIAVLSAFALSNCSSGSRPEFRGQVTALAGTGRHYLASRHEWKPLKKSALIRPGDSVTTDEESKAVIALRNGSTMTVTEGTTIYIEELINQEKQHTVRVHNAGGTVLSDIRKLGPNRHYEVVTPTSVAEVKGTFFSVSFFASTNKAKVHVWDGTVMVHDPAVAAAAIAVPAGFFTMVAFGLVPIVPVRIEYREFAHFQPFMPPGQYKKLMHHYGFVPVPVFWDSFDDFVVEKHHRGLRFKGHGGDVRIKGAGPFDVKIKDAGPAFHMQSGGKGYGQRGKGKGGGKGKGK